MKERIFISIGSNMGDKARNCASAVIKLTGLDGTRVIAKSALYSTPPWGNEGQDDFVNMAVELETTLDPKSLLSALEEVELAMGRVPSGRWGPRIIDLDIVFYGSRVIEETFLSVPHPLASERAFVLVPLNDIAPDFVHPVLGKTVAELAAQANAGRVKRLD